MNYIENAIKNAVLIKQGENVLLVYDKPKEKIADLFFKSCEKIGAEVCLVRIKEREETRREPPKPITQAMKFSDVVLAITNQ